MKKALILIILTFGFLTYWNSTYRKVNSFIADINKSFYFDLKCKRQANNLDCKMVKDSKNNEARYQKDLAGFHEWEPMIRREFKKRGISGEIKFRQEKNEQV